MVLDRALVAAASRNDVNALEAWFSQDAARDVDESDEHGRTLLLFAARCGSCGAMELLLARGAAVNAACSWDVTPLHEAAVEGRRDAVAMLLERGAEIDAVSSHGYTPLMDAAVYGRLDVMRYLLGHGARASPGDGFADHRETLALLGRVRAAGGWRSYVSEPRRRLLALRALVDAGRATPPGGDGPLPRLFNTGNPRRVGVLARLCGCRGAARGAALPTELFWLVLQFWRCTTDSDRKIAHGRRR